MYFLLLSYTIALTSLTPILKNVDFDIEFIIQNDSNRRYIYYCIESFYIIKILNNKNIRKRSVKYFSIR